MFDRLGSLTYRLRYVVVVAWVVAAVVSVLFAPSIATSGQADQAGFLPATSASVQAKHALEAAFPDDTATSSVTLTFERTSGLTDADRAFIADTSAWISSDAAPDALRGRVGSVETAADRPELASILQSADGQLEIAAVNLDVTTAGDDGAAAVRALRDRLAVTTPAGLATHVTGTAAISADYMDAIIRGTDSTTLVTIVLVVVILLLIYRAPIAAAVPLATIGAAFLVARGVLGMLAAAGWQVSSLLDTFVVVLVFGVGTDYTIFLISRFREELADADAHEASRLTVRRIGEVITASAATVIVGLGSMAFADFGMIQTTGPALAVAIVVTLLAGLTLAPALLAIFGPHLFWPLHLRLTREDEPGGFFARLATAVSHRPGTVTAIVLVALLIPATAIGGMRTNFDVLAELPATSDARIGFDQVADHMGRGNIVQSSVIVTAARDRSLLTAAALANLRDLTRQLLAQPGVASVTTLVSPAGDGVVPDGLQPSQQLAAMADGFRDDGSGSDATAGSEAILDPAVTDGLTTASDYVAGLAVAYPDLVGSQQLTRVQADLATALDEIESARDAARVSTQLHALASSLRSPASLLATTGSDATTSPSLIADYLDELAAAQPEVRDLAAFEVARRHATALATTPDLAAALDLASSLEQLAEHYDARPDVTLFPDSLSGTPEAKARQREIRATFDRLPVGIEALSTTFAARADDIYVPTNLDGDDGADVNRAVDAFMGSDRSAIRMYLTTTDDPYSPAAFRTVHEVQGILTDAAAAFGPSATARLSGPTAELADVQTVLQSDFLRVGVITVIGILAVLIVLLRAVVAPIYLVGTVLLSCATAIGLSSWLFQGPLGQPGVSFYLPLLVFVLLVALGSDYNIFLMSRVREESADRPVRDGIRIASGRTGAVITSAGLILAGTFGSMASAPLAVLFQVGVAVALGVLIDTFVVRSILVPAITMLVGARAWWPSGSGLAAALRGRPTVTAPALLPDDAADAAGRGGGPRARRAVVLAMIVLVPLAFAFLFTWSFAGAGDRLSGVTGAVVDLDAGATRIAADGSRQAVTLGADLSQRLLDGNGLDGLTWLAADEGDAADGLADGTYGLVLTIPPDYSSRVIAIERDTTGTANRPTLGIETADGASAAAETAAGSISRAVADATASGVVGSYVDDVLVRVTGAHEDLTTGSRRATTIADGSSTLESQANDIAALTGELVTGLDALSAGAVDAGAGAQQLASALQRLASGSSRLAGGTTDLADGVDTARAGAAGVADGATTLAAGLATLAGSVSALPARTTDLANGSAAVAAGAVELANGTHALADSLSALDAGASGLGSRTDALSTAASDVATGAGQIGAGAAQAHDGATALAGGVIALATSVDAYTDSVSTLSTSCAALGGTAAVCDQLAAIVASGATLDAAAGSAASGAQDLATSLDPLVADASQLADGAATLAAGTAALASAAPALETGVAGLAAGAADLASGGDQLASGAQQAAAGTSALADGMPALVNGIGTATSGARSLAGGTRAVSDGLGALADGAGSLAGGATRTADGAATIADGAAAAAGSTDRMVDALDQLLDGARMADAGAADVAGAGGSLADEARGLATDLDGSATGVPAYSADAREALSMLLADPVTVDVVAGSDAGAALEQAPYFMALGLWVGALAMFLVLPAIGGDRRPRAGVRATIAYLAAAALGAAQAMLMVVALLPIDGVAWDGLPAMLAVTLLASLAFIAITQALVAVFGARGWFLALLVVAVQLTSAGWPYPISTAPWPFQALHPLMPMTYAVDAITAAATGTGSLATPVLVLSGWLAVAFLVTLAMAARSEPRHTAPHATAAAA